MELKTEGIVLKRYEKGENDNVTVIFTKETGKVAVVSKSTKKPGSRLKSTLELFSVNRYFLTKKNSQSQYFILIQSQPVNAFQGIRLELKKIALAYYIVELLDKFMQLEEENRELYELALYVLSGIDECRYKDLAEAGSFFKLKLLKIAGFNMTEDAEFLVKRGVSAELEKLMSEIERSGSSEEVKGYNTYADELDRLLDSYIVTVLDEEIASRKFFERLR
jgi:DNA repair protein RecO